MSARAGAVLVGLDDLVAGLEQGFSRGALLAAVHSAGAAAGSTLPVPLRRAATRLNMDAGALLPAQPSGYESSEIAVRIRVRLRDGALDRAALGERLRLRLVPRPRWWGRLFAALRRRLLTPTPVSSGELEIRVRATGATLVLVNGRRLPAGKAEER